MRLREIVVGIAQVGFGRTIDEPASAIAHRELLLAKLVARQHKDDHALQHW